MKILAVGDLHFPWALGRALYRVEQIAKEVQPDAIVQVGDLYDMFSFGRWARSGNVILPKEELKWGRAKAARFWERMQGCAPQAACYQLLGNHDVRPEKRIQEYLPGLSGVLDVGALWRFPGVETIGDPREVLVLGGVAFIHGHLSKLGDHAKFLGRKTVCGHSHRGGVWYGRAAQGSIWELNCGYLGDRTKVPLQYDPLDFSQWTRGVGLVDEFGPRFIPFNF